MLSDTVNGLLKRYISFAYPVYLAHPHTVLGIVLLLHQIHDVDSSTLEDECGRRSRYDATVKNVAGCFANISTSGLD